VRGRRETVSGYLKAAGIVGHGRGRRSESNAAAAISTVVSMDASANMTLRRCHISDGIVGGAYLEKYGRVSPLLIALLSDHTSARRDC